MAYIGRQQDGFGVRSRFIFTATGGQTTFTTDDSSNPLSYSDGAYVDVYLNGVLLDPSDYTATSLTSIVLDSGATASDILEVIVYDVFSVFSGTFTNGITANTATITGDLTVDTNTLYVDSTNNNVGIGTTSPTGTPTTTLHINGTTNAGIHITDSASGATDSDGVYFSMDNPNLYIQNKENGFTAFETNATERMRIDSSGNVGIGTSSPQAGLHIDNPSDGAITAILDTDNSAVKMIFRNTTETGNNLQIGADGSNLVSFTNGSERMRIDSSGNVGISTNSPSAPLQVSRSDAGIIQYITNTGSAQAYTAYGNSDNPPWSQDFNTAGGLLVGIDSDETGVVYQGGNKALRFGTNATERMRITSTGDLLVGTTTSAGSGGVTLRSDGIMIAPAVYGTAVSASLRDIQMDSSGFFGYSTSTRATKGNIEDLSDVSWLYNLNPVSFNRKVFDRETNSFKDELLPETEYGLIAEDVEEVNANLCFYNETDNGQELAGITYSKLITPLIKALQEANEKTKTLEARIVALENA